MTPTLKQSVGAQFTRIYSYGAARGDLVVPNEDLIGPIDSSDEWIRQRTGIITRTRALPPCRRNRARDDGEPRGDREVGRRGHPTSTSSSSATVSNTLVTPSISAVVSDRVGVNPAAAYDSNAACAGFSYAVTQADALIRSGAAHYALVDRCGEALRVRRPGRPLHLVPARRRCRRGRHRPERHARNRRRPCGARMARSADAVEHEPHAHRLPPGWRGVADPAPGRTHGVPLGRLGDGQGRQAGARGRRHRGQRSRRVRAAPGQHAHHRRARQAAETARHRHHRSGHRDDRQHVRGIHPAGDAPAARGASRNSAEASPCRSDSAPDSSSARKS